MPFCFKLFRCANKNFGLITKCAMGWKPPFTLKWKLDKSDRL